MDTPLILLSWEHIPARLCLQAGGAAELEDVFQVWRAQLSTLLHAEPVTPINPSPLWEWH